MGREEGSGWETHVYLWWIHFDKWQNQCNIGKLKNKIKKKKKKVTLVKHKKKKKKKERKIRLIQPREKYFKKASRKTDWLLFFTI